MYLPLMVQNQNYVTLNLNESTMLEGLVEHQDFQSPAAISYKPPLPEHHVGTRS
jgi:hypothetical protein